MIHISRVAGVNFCQDAVKEIEEGDQATLIREPENPYDSNAIRVEVRGTKIGYVPKSWNAELIEPMANGKKIKAIVSSVGRTKAELPIGVWIHIEIY